MPKSKKSQVALPRPSRRKSATIQKAKNGYVVSSFSDQGETVVIAKTKAEAKKAASKMLDI